MTKYSWGKLDIRIKTWKRLREGVGKGGGRGGQVKPRASLVGFRRGNIPLKNEIFISSKREMAQPLKLYNMNNNVQQWITTLIIFFKIFLRLKALALFGPDMTDIKMTGSMKLNAYSENISPRWDKILSEVWRPGTATPIRGVCCQESRFLWWGPISTLGGEPLSTSSLQLSFCAWRENCRDAYYICNMMLQGSIHKREDTKFISCPKRNNLVNISEKNTFLCIPRKCENMKNIGAGKLLLSFCTTVCRRSFC